MLTIYRRWNLFLVVLLTLLGGQQTGLAGGVPTAAMTDSTTPGQPAGTPELQEQELWHAVNQVRRDFGLRALQADDALATAARQHAEEMAELNYLGHESPNLQSRTLQDRLVLAGAAVQGAGENLAQLSDGADLAAQVVAGWLDSPGHRQNLLAAHYTHVGFGVARNSQGSVWVAQVLGRKKVDVISTSVRPAVLRTNFVQIDFQLQQPAEVAFWLGGENTQPASYAVGRHSVEHEWNPPAKAQVYAGMRSTAGTVFIRMDGGWFEPAAGSWSPEARSGSAELLIEAVQPKVQKQEVWQVELQLAAIPSANLGTWIDGEWAGSPTLSGETLQFEVPRRESAPLIEVGLQLSDSAHEYEIALRFSVEAQLDGQPQVRMLY